MNEYQQKKRNELEEQRQIKAQMREEKLALQEIEQAQKHADKQEQFYKDELERVRHELQDTSQAKQDEFEKIIAELEKKLANASMEKQGALARAQLTRSGHVYVISNIGSFGEHVYKIGMTRRLEPMDRVKELGDASVPFIFDVHAMIYADDAPTLESELHRRFSQHRLNLVNHRKEFFRVSLDEIAEVVRELHGEIEFSLIADTSEYRQTMARRLQAANQAPSTVQPISPPPNPSEHMDIAAGYST